MAALSWNSSSEVAIANSQGAKAPGKLSAVDLASSATTNQSPKPPQSRSTPRSASHYPAGIQRGQNYFSAVIGNEIIPPHFFQCSRLRCRLSIFDHARQSPTLGQAKDWLSAISQLSANVKSKRPPSNFISADQRQQMLLAEVARRIATCGRDSKMAQN